MEATIFTAMMVFIGILFLANLAKVVSGGVKLKQKNLKRKTKKQRRV